MMSIKEIKALLDVGRALVLYKDEQAMRSIGMSDSAIYHCAGDSIVVDVLMDIFKELL